ncbi:leucyl aminopeptidase family protein [Aquiflexum sp. LQ15W]|uniref:leucyl aminopeptidase family protein n=1 Tax=Cognataquiflexum nitidum TaxID=2922272 RepID=UPI001F13C2BB|nr:leucyl aminopeptidase family protein [Cognataquiflexum nitidum]MCH6200912.1 leucyl aminopeptidase family protein [Cognataquiflexum nitidum]
MKITPIKSSVNFKGLVIIPFFEQEENDASISFESFTISKHLFLGKKDSQFILEDNGSERIYLLVGLGKSPNYKNVKTVFRRLTARQEVLFEKKVLVWLNDKMDSDFLEAAVSGLFLGTYRLGHYKKSENEAKNWSKINISIFSAVNESKKIIEKGLKIAAAQIETFNLVDLPPNKITPKYLADWASDAGKKFGFDVKVLDKKKAEKENLKAFLAVGQGSQREPQFIIMKYRSKSAKKHFGLVGKGVTFDTGGLNIKTQGMVHMKCDMGGAATVLGAMQLIADLGLEVNITAVVPCVENAIDSRSFLPSDVIGSYSGKTIEVIDTDAEGRLILADGLSYLIQNFKPDTVIDFATLTGSAVGTFGYECAALFSKNEELSKNLQQYGEKIGERLWPLPMWDEYKTEMDSEIADIKNYHGKPYAGAITAAKFLEYFTENHTSWAHIDIAGTAFGDSEFAKTKHATAYGVHLLIKLIENL